MNIVYFYRNQGAGVSINKVAQTISRLITDKKEHYLPCLTPSLVSIIKNILYVYRNRDKKSVNQIVGGEQYAVLGLVRCKSVLVVHDTVSLEYRELPYFKKQIFRYIWYSLPLRFATKIVCISDETRKRVERYTKRKDLVVIHNAIDPILKQYPLPVHDVLNILIIGTGENKNLVRTFEALKGLRCRVTIIGHLSERQLLSLKENDINYINKYNLTDEQIIDEYNNCDIVSFISLFEGFGMILVEANSVGRPVICSDIPVLREIAGDAALFVDPKDVLQMRNGFLRLLSDNELRCSLVDRGLVNARRFSVDKILAKWNSLYSSL